MCQAVALSCLSSNMAMLQSGRHFHSFGLKITHHCCVPIPVWLNFLAKLCWLYLKKMRCSLTTLLMLLGDSPSSSHILILQVSCCCHQWKQWMFLNARGSADMALNYVVSKIFPWRCSMPSECRFVAFFFLVASYPIQLWNKDEKVVEVKCFVSSHWPRTSCYFGVAELLLGSWLRIFIDHS